MLTAPAKKRKSAKEREAEKAAELAAHEALAESLADHDDDDAEIRKELQEVAPYIAVRPYEGIPRRRPEEPKQEHAPVMFADNSAPPSQTSEICLIEIADAVHGAIEWHNSTKAELVQRVIAAGELLAEAKASMPHGEWTAWLKKNFDKDVSTARFFLRCYHKREKLRDAKVESFRAIGRLIREPKTSKHLTKDTCDSIIDGEISVSPATLERFDGLKPAQRRQVEAEAAKTKKFKLPADVQAEPSFSAGTIGKSIDELQQQIERCTAEAARKEAVSSLLDDLRQAVAALFSATQE
jgi:hypothetical protein